MSEPTDEELRRLREEKLAKQAADQAVRKVFAMLGVNMDDAESVEEFRRDIRFGGVLRRAADKGWTALIVTFVAAMLGALWLGVQSLIHR